MKTDFSLGKATITALFCCFIAFLLPVSLAAGDVPAVSVQKNGSIQMENGLLSLRWGNGTGGGPGDCGISSLRFKPIDAEMVDVLYGQTDYLTGQLFGEVWDPVEHKGFQQARVRTGAIYAPEEYGVAADGSAALVRQVSEGPYSLSRTAILRRDLATVEVSYRLANVDASPGGFSLRLRNIMSPSARGKSRNVNETIRLITEEGPLALEQNLSLSEFKERYKDQKYFLPVWDNEPKRPWVGGKLPTSPLKSLWAIQTGGREGDGMMFLFGEDALVGYYNSPGATLEPVLKAQALRSGESWEFTCYMSPFTGLPENMTPVDVNPLFISIEKVGNFGGKFTGKVLPLFDGTLKALDKAGKTVLEHSARAGELLALNGKTKGEDWTLEAFDREGKLIGRVNADGTFSLSEVSIVSAVPQTPKFSGEIYSPDEGRFAEFLKARDFVVYCDWKASDAEKEGARRIARQLGVGLMWTQPDQKAIIIGNPSTSELVRDIGKFKHSFSPDWPGPDKGAIVLYDNVELIQEPAIVIGGSDAAGTQDAIARFEKDALEGVEAPKGFALRAADAGAAVFPYTPIDLNPEGEQVIRVKAAKGEYEPAQVILKAYDTLRDVSVTASPLVNTATGEELKGRYLTPYRKARGPLWLRWVDYYPLNPPDGATGVPDPLIEKPVVDIPEGTTRALWLTFIVPQDAEAGDYRGTLAVEANGIRKELPIELTVWDFEIPREGIKGEPYMSYQAFPPDNKRWLRPAQVKQLTENLVEHGMRVLHVGENNDSLFRWHFDPEGKIKSNEWLTVSDDGKVALDTKGFDERIAQVDAAGKPFELEYLVPLGPIINWPEGFGDFRRAFPDRFKDQPEREGHAYSSYYVQEMLSLLKKHLEKKGWLDRVTVKIGDEPPGFKYWWDAHTLAAREAGIPFVTCLNSVRWDEVDVALGSTMRWVQPLYMYYDRDFFEKARKAGMKVSWYNCGPPPRNTVQTPASHLRAYIWQGAKADLDIIAWWGIQNWNHHSHHDLWYYRYSHWNSLIYPEHPEIAPWRDARGLHDASPIDSRRWEQIRDGLEDSAYVRLLRERIAAAKERGETEKAAKAQAVLDGIWNEIFPTLNDYDPSFEGIMESREKVANAILELGEEKK